MVKKTNGVEHAPINNVQTNTEPKQAQAQASTFWQKSKTIYRRGRNRFVDNLAELTSQVYTLGAETYQRVVAPVYQEAQALGADVYAVSRDAWEQGAQILDRNHQQYIKPIFSDAEREQQLREMMSEAQFQAQQQLTQRVNRNLAAGTLSLALAITGSLVYPPLQILAVPGLLYAVRHMFQNSYRAVFHERTVHVNVLSSITVISCLLGGYIVAANITGFFFALAQKLIMQIRNDSKLNLVNVFRQSAHFAWVVVDGVEVQTAIEQLKQGDRIVINAGEQIPVDGIIIEGFATIDQHILTGEAQPAEKGVDDQVFAMTLVLAGRIQVAVERAGTETTAAQIGQLLNRTAEFKTDVQLRAEALAQKTVWPTLLLSAAALPFLGLMGATGIIAAHFGNRMTAVSGISTLNYFRILSRCGILVKDGRTLEVLPKVDMVVFDKTGTLTQEQPTVAVIHTAPGAAKSYSPEEILCLAAAAEYKQSHPIARAIRLAAHQRQLSLPPIREATYKVGYGICVQIEQAWVRVGSIRFMESEGIAIPTALQALQTACHAQGHSLVWVAIDDAVAGAIELKPTLRPEAKAVISGLRAQGVKSIVIISGDHEAPTRQLAQELGVDRYFAETLPQNKAGLIEQLQNEGHAICYVGDGINDTIALKKAQVSVSLRGAATAATDTAQIILMDQTLQQLNTLFEVSKAFAQTLEKSLNLLLAPMVVGIGGAYLIGLPIVPILLLKDAFTWVSIGNAMWPLHTYRGLLLSDTLAAAEGKHRAIGQETPAA